MCDAMKSDLIYKQDAIDAVMDGMCSGWYCDVVERIKALPAADVAPVRRGRWVYGENDGQDGWYCSECHFFIPWYYDWYGLDNIDFIKDFHACPHCSAKMVTYTGAKMDGDFCQKSNYNQTKS